MSDTRGHLDESKYEANFAFSFDLNLDLESLFKLVEAKVGGVLLLITSMGFPIKETG